MTRILLTFAVVLAPLTALAAAEPRRDADGEPLPNGAVMRLGSRRFRVGSVGTDWFRFLPDGSILSFRRPHGPGDRLVRIDAVTGRITQDWPLPYDLEPKGLSPDGRYVVLVKSQYRYTFDDATIHREPESAALQVFDLTTGKVVWKRQDEPQPYRWSDAKAALFSPDSSRITILVEDFQRTNLIAMVEAAGGREVKRLARANSELLGFAADGSVALFDTKTDAIVRLDRDTLEERGSFPPGKALAAGLAPDGRHGLTTTDGPKVHVWDIASGKRIGTIDGDKNRVTLFAFAPDSKSVVTASDDRVVRVSDWPTSVARRRIDLARRAEWLGVTPDGKRLAVNYSGEHVLNYFELETGKPVSLPREGHRGPIYALAFAADGKLISTGPDGSACAWDLATGRCFRQRELGGDSGSVALSPDGSLVAMTDRNQRSLRIIDATSGALRRTITHADKISWGKFSADGHRYLAHTLSETQIWSTRVFDLANGTAVFLVPPGPKSNGGQSSAMSPDGRVFASAYYTGPLRLWDATTWNEQPSFNIFELENQRQGPESVYDLRFSPDGRSLVTSGNRGIRVWELVTGRVRAEFLQPNAYVHSLRFSRSGRWLAWADAGLRIHVWDIRRDEEIVVRDKAPANADHGDAVMDLCFTPDDRLLVTAHGDGTMLVWDLNLASAKAKRPATSPSAMEIAAAWTDMGSADGKAAFAAIRVLGATPAEGLRLIRDGLKPAGPIDSELVKRLVSDLNDARFAVRDKAMADLAKIGVRTADALDAFVATKPPAEAQKRASRLLELARGRTPGPERLREIRAVELLERIGGDEARRVLESLAAGAGDAPLTRDAAEALKRLR